MKLFYSVSSPYSRKTRVTLIEKGLDDRVEKVVCNPFGEAGPLIEASPLGKVPALLTDDGAILFDRPVICAYLSALSAKPDLFGDGPGHWAARTGEALADGILDATFLTVVELRRPAQQQSDMWLHRWNAAIGRALDSAEAQPAVFRSELTLAQIALGCALGYLDFRLPAVDWRKGRPETAEWYARFLKRPYMQQTEPFDL